MGRVYVRQTCTAEYRVDAETGNQTDAQCAGANCTYEECCIVSEQCAASALNSTASCASYASGSASGADPAVSGDTRLWAFAC